MSHTPEETTRQVELVAKKKAHHDDKTQPNLTAEEKLELADLLKTE
jgi:hypothetical protein